MHMPCSNSEGPENVFDGQLTYGSATRALTQPPTWGAQVSYVFLQLTLDREYK